MPGIFLGPKFQACVYFLGLQYEAPSDPPRHVYFEYPPPPPPPPPGLDGQIRFDTNHICTDLYTKPTDKHQHQLYSSCHPLHTKKAIPFSLALRLRRICSTDETFNTRAAQLTTYLLKRGYNRNLVTKQIQRAADTPRRLALQTKDGNKLTRIPFITTFNPSLPRISYIIKNHYHLLLSSNRCKNVFQQQLPVVAFKRSPNLRDLLVIAKLPSNSTNPHPQLPSGSFRCGKNCATCPYISDGLTTYSFFSTNETRHINSNLTCDTKNLIYMIQCNRCNLQYIGETKRRLKDRFNEHRRTIDIDRYLNLPQLRNISYPLLTTLLMTCN